ncbi:hypothetical protein ACMFMG_003905 [Clarireedia jacksonii]
MAVTQVKSVLVLQLIAFLTLLLDFSPSLAAPTPPHPGWHFTICSSQKADRVSTIRWTMAQATNIWRPYESNPANPVLSNAHTSEFFQDIGHADLFQNANSQW